MLLLLITLMSSGLMRAGTDIYFPPFGSWVQDYLAADQVSPSSLKPYDETSVDPHKLKQLKAFKPPISRVHLYTAYLLLAKLMLHIAAVIVKDRREGGAIISAMFTGGEYLSGKPLDADGPD